MSEARYFSLRSEPAWRRGALLHVTAGEGGIAIRRRNVYRPARRDEAEHPRVVRPIASAAADPSGRWLLLDQAAGVWKADLSSGHIEALLAAGHGWFGAGSTLTALEETWAAADPDSSPTLLLLSASNAQVLWAKADWQGQPFRAHAVAEAGGGRIAALAVFDAEAPDYGAQQGGTQPPNVAEVPGHAEAAPEWAVLRYGPAGEEVGARPLDPPLDPEPPNASPARRTPRFELSCAPDGVCWLLDRHAQAVARIDFGAETPAEWTPLPEAVRPATALCASSADGCWIVRRVSGAAARELLLLGSDGQPLDRGDAGTSDADRLQGGPDGRLFAWDNEESSVTTLRARPETAVWEPLGRRAGVWLGGSLDSTSAETEWHKLVVEAECAPDTQIRIRYYASDRKAAFVGGALVPDLDRYIADETIAPEDKLAALRELWSEPIVDPRDALLFGAKGRYLWLHIELIGSEANTPVVRGVQVHFPRMSYVSDLPAVYQRDARSKDFLDRFLSLFQTMLEETDAKITDVPRSFDPEASSGASLRWLLGWLGLDEDDHWTDAQLRELLRAAPTIYKLRGTRYALETLIAIYTGEKPIILEYDQLKPLKEHPELGTVAEKLYSVDRYGFNVLVKPEHADTETKRVTLQHLIDSVKPAFAIGKLIILQPWVYMDLHSYLGLNTVLSEPTLLRLDGSSSMPHHTITIDVGEDNRVDQHTRLELDSRLE